MRISILQMNIAWCDPEGNSAIVKRLLAESQKANLYVLPEMWNTGFITDIHELRHQGFDILMVQERSLKWMKQIAQEYDAAFCGTMATMGTGGKFLNRTYFVEPDGKVSVYDKHHLFKYGGEHLHYQAGHERTVVDYRGIRFLLVTCYDLRFPVWERYRGDYDAIIVQANWPSTRKHAWQILLQARAIENQCYVIGCNRVGDDKICHYTGNSTIVDSRGFALAEGEEDQEQCLTADIDIEIQNHFRDKFRVLDDRDTYTLL